MHDAMKHAETFASPSARPVNIVSVEGSVLSVSGLGVKVDDRLGALDIGARVKIKTREGWLDAETVGIDQNAALCMPFGELRGVRRGARVIFGDAHSSAYPAHAWLGRVIDGLGRPIDGKGRLPEGVVPRALRASPPPAPMRARLGGRVDFGVKALTAFAPARAGQRLGIFSGSGIGKSALLSMIARATECDVAVIALIGERGREVREFIEDNLGAEGLSRAVMIVATSDEPAMMRREAAFLAMTVAEYFRDAGRHVLCLMDSVTRVAAAQREIGLAAGEPPTAKGFTPSVFSLLPGLLERAGPGLDDGRSGAITGIFTVLVEGDDHDEPIADAARAILDGHIVLDRRIAERGRFPAIDILKTVSRAQSAALGDVDAAMVARAKSIAAAYEDMREMIRIGAYRPGANPEIDIAIAFHPILERFLTQSCDDIVDSNQSFEMLKAAFAELDEQWKGAAA